MRRSWWAFSVAVVAVLISAGKRIAAVWKHAALGACDQLFEIQRAALELPYPGVLPEGPAPKKAFGS